MTEWREVPGFAYEVSSEGDVRPTKPRYRTGRRSGNLRPWVVNRHGRESLYVSLHREKKRHKFLVHVLVAWAFLGDKPEGHDVAHLNHCSTDNRLVNLAYVPHGENVRDAFSEEAQERRAIVEHECGLLEYVPTEGLPF